MKVALLGDIALFGRCTKPEYFETISQYLSRFDYVVGNLETPFSAKKRTHGAKSAYICADPTSISILKHLNLNAVTLANNHMFDFGNEGYELTKQLLNNAGIAWFGSEGKEHMICFEGNKIAFSGFCCYTTNPLQCVKYGQYGVNAFNLNVACDVLRRNSREGYLNIIAVHAGLEHVNYPSIEHVRAARKIANTGPYVYYGHHPHVAQGVEEYNGSLIAHSLGNFCFDDVFTENSDKPLVTLTDNNRRGLVLELIVEESKVKSWREQVVVIDKEGRIRLGSGSEELSEYNSSLVHSEDNEVDYCQRREQIINSRLSERKSMRDVTWYLKRLKLRYVKILINAKRNEQLFKKNVLKFI